MWIIPREGHGPSLVFSPLGEMKKSWEFFEKTLQTLGLYGIIIERDCTGVPDKGAPDMR